MEEMKTVTLAVPIGGKPPVVGEPLISKWFEEETVILVKTIDELEWKIYDDLNQLMVTVTGEVLQRNILK